MRGLARWISRIQAAVLAASLLIPSAASAAALTSISDVMTNQLPSQPSNHEIRFTTPTGVDASSDTITLTFDVGFDLSSILVGDIDLFHGPTGLETSETLSGSAAPGIWGVSISGQVVTFIAPTDAALGEIATGDVVVIRIGQNAAGGSNRIVNPSSDGSTYALNIAGTFGDSGGTFLSIGTDQQIAVSATVAAAPPPPGGGGGPPIDSTPPTIFDIQVFNITTSTADIHWQTNEPADGRINYGLSSAYDNTVFDATFSTSHTIRLIGLTEDTLYHFQIIARDPVLNTTSTGDMTFRTAVPPHAPVISNIRVVSITDRSAIVLWDTDIPASSLVEFGTTAAYGRSASTPGFVTSHAVSLDGLTPNTLYHFRVISAEPTGLTSVSGDNTFLTLADATPPSNVIDFRVTPGDRLNTLTWTNPPDADFSNVVIRALTTGYPTGPTDGRLVYSGSGTSFVDLGLTNGVTYYYGNFAYDTSGNHSSGAFAQGTPFGALPPTTTPPTPPPTPPTPPRPPTPPGGATTTPPTPPGAVTTTPPTPEPGPEPTPEPEPEPEPQPGVTLQLFFFGGAGQIPLEPDASGTVYSPAGSPVLITVPVAGLGALPQRGIVTVGGSTYALTPLPGGTSWGASFVPTGPSSRIPVTVTFFFEDGRTASARATIGIVSPGRILGRDFLGAEPRPLPGARVTLYEGGRVWDGARYGQANPIITGPSGAYAFTVLNGTYRIVAERDGYVTQEKTISVTNNVASVDIVLPTEIDIPFVGDILEFLQTEQAQEAARITAPVVLAVALVNLALAASLASLLNYLWFLFTQPVLLFGRKKRQKYGVVYNALSKLPIDLAAVRLLHATTKVVLQTRITDAKGRFFFKVKPGSYRIEVVKTGYVFPTQYLRDQKEDVDYLDLYHGEVIEVKEETNIAPNVPVDPLVKEEVPRKVVFKMWLRKFQHVLAISGVIISAIALLIAPSLLLGGLLVLQILTYLLFRRLAKAKKPKEWGIVYDRKTRRPVGRVIVRIFDKKFNKLLETQVTDTRGRYGFFAGKNVYFLTAESKDYAKYRSEDIDLSKKEQALIDQHIPLQKGEQNKR